MDQTGHDELSEWIQKSAALLAPPAAWEPNRKAALARLEARGDRHFPARRLLLIGAVALGITCVLGAASPLTRVLAQQAGISWYRLDQFWYWITIGRNQQLVRLARLPDEVKSLGSHPVTIPGAPQVVSDVAEAARRSGFIPGLPGSSAVGARPRLSVLEAASFGMVFRTAELELALRQPGVADQSVPAAWDGSWIGVQVGARVTAEWSDLPGSEPGTDGWAQMTLTQSTSPVFAVPPEIDLTSFAALNLRATGMSPDSARRFARYAVPPSALLLGNGARNEVSMEHAIAARYVSLRHGPAILIEEWGDLGHNEWEHGPPIRGLILLWSVPGRVYVLKGDLKAPLELASYALAGAVATVIDVADTIN